MLAWYHEGPVSMVYSIVGVTPPLAPQAFPPVPEERKPNSRLQERLLKKLGQHAHPFYFTVSPTCLPSWGRYIWPPCGNRAAHVTTVVIVSCGIVHLCRCFWVPGKPSSPQCECDLSNWCQSVFIWADHMRNPLPGTFIPVSVSGVSASGKTLKSGF